MTDLRFYNVWEADSENDKSRLIAVMRRETAIFVDQPGFVSLRGWVSESDNRVIAEATWSSRADFEAALIENPEAQRGRQRMQEVATEAPAVFTLAFTHLPGRADAEARDSDD